MTTIWDFIQYVNKFGSHKNQLRYDAKRERIYSLVALQVASLQPKSVLDVGCAYGTLDVFLSRTGMKIKAIDIFPDLHNKELFTKEGIEFEETNIEKESLSGEYDACILTDVLEHFCYNPLPILKKIRKHCKGIVLTTPARETDYICEGKWKDVINWRQIPNYTAYKFEDGHHHTYTRSELEDLLKEAGFTIEHVQYLPVEYTWLVRAR